MTDAKKMNTLRRTAALLLALFLSLNPLFSIAQTFQNPIDFTLLWTGQDGTPRESVASLLDFPEYPNSFWLYVDPEALSQNAVLHIDDNFSQYSGFSIDNDQPISTVFTLDAGQSPGDDNFIEVVAYDQSGNAAAVYQLFLSSLTAEPLPPQEEPEVIPDALVNIHYVDVENNEVASSQSKTFPAGSHMVYPEPQDLQADYLPFDVEPKPLTVDANGANPQDIYFIYQYQAPAISASVTVYYIGPNSEEVAQSKQMVFDQQGSYDIIAAPADLLPGYTLNDAETKQVAVDQNGASPSEVYFNYSAPQPVINAVVNIYYVGPNGEEVAQSQQMVFDQQGSYDIIAAPADLLPSYTLNDAETKQVAVDQNGASPSEVYFNYSAPQPVINAVVNIYYVGPNGEEVAQSQQMVFDQAGSFDIQASPDNLLEGYTLLDAAAQTVSVDQNGANPSQISFHYSAPAIPDAQVTLRYLNEEGAQVADIGQINLSAGEHAVYAEPSNLEPGYDLIQQDPQIVIVNQNGAQPNEVTFIYRSLMAQPVDIAVRFVDMDGNQLAQDRIQTVIDGTNAIKADLLEGYDLQGEDTQYVQVTQDGAEPGIVIFRYSLKAAQTPVPQEPTAPPAPKVDFVNVIYQDQFGNTLYEDKEKVVEGEETPISVDLAVINQDLYELNDAAQKTATIDSEGRLNPQVIVFLFTAKPVDVSARLPVYYRNEAGEQVADPQEIVLTQAGFNTVSPNPANLMPGYEIISTQDASVLVNDDSTLSPTELVFVYKMRQSEQTPVPIETSYDITPLENVYIHPHKDQINIRSSPRIDESNVVGVVNMADVGKVIGLALNEKQEEWYLAQLGEQEAFIKKSVTVQMTPEEVNTHFGWTPFPATQEPAPTAVPEGMLIGRWGETNVGQLGFRKDPNDKVSNNIITRLDKNVKIWVYAQEIVGAANELWYEAMAAGKVGFVKAQFVQLYEQEQSDQYNMTLASPVPDRITPSPDPDEVSPSPSPLVTQEPTAPPSDIPTATPLVSTQSPQPQAYLGYALTVQQTALRTGANIQDESILATLPANTLLHTIAQTYVPNGEIWHHVDVLNGSNFSGFVPDSAIRRISPTEAETFMKSAQPPTAVPTRVPDRVSGYAITLGRDVLMREYSDTNAKISRVLAEDTIVMVTGQEYVAGVAWHLVQHNGLYGFIRADQLRMLSMQETQLYLESLKQTPPPPQATLPPLSTDSLSSYGYINTNKVRLRKDTSTSSATVKLMDKNAFALVVDSVKGADGNQWYRINQNGTEGYVMGRYLSVLKLGELQQYLNSNDFQSGNNYNPPNQSGGTSSITPLEDYNNVVWQNPNIQTSYEPFNPIATATPPVEAIFSPAVSPEAGDFVVEASPSLDPLATFEPMGTEAPTATTSRFPTAWLAVGIIGVLGGGGYYAYRMYQDNQRKAAQRAAQRRQQTAPQQGRPPAGAQAPLTRPAGNQATRPGQTPGSGQGSSPYAPPGNAQGTAPYRPLQPGQVPPPPGSQGTTAYRPTQPGQVPPPPGSQGTAAYRPTQPGQVPPAPGSQGTTAYRPTRPGQVPPSTGSQGTTAYRPTQPGQVPPPPINQGTAVYRPAQPGQVPPPAGSQSTSTYKPLENGQISSKAPFNQEPGSAAQQTEAQQKTERKRRADRHTDDDKA